MLLQRNCSVFHSIQLARSVALKCYLVFIHKLGQEILRTKWRSSSSSCLTIEPGKRCWFILTGQNMIRHLSNFQSMKTAWSTGRSRRSQLRRGKRSWGEWCLGELRVNEYVYPICNDGWYLVSPQMCFSGGLGWTGVAQVYLPLL